MLEALRSRLITGTASKALSNAVTKTISPAQLKAGADSFKSSIHFDEGISKYISSPTKSMGENLFSFFIKRSLLKFNRTINTQEARNVRIRATQAKKLSPSEIEQVTSIQETIKKEFGVDTDIPYDKPIAEQLHKILAFLHKEGYKLPEKIVSTYPSIRDTQILFGFPIIARPAGLSCPLSRKITATIPTQYRDERDKLVFYSLTILHEIGHTLNFNNLNKAEFMHLRLNKFNKETRKLMKENFGRKTSVVPIEFAAEYFSLRMLPKVSIATIGWEFSPKLEEINRLLKGPEIK